MHGGAPEVFFYNVGSMKITLTNFPTPSKKKNKKKNWKVTYDLTL
jgi:hypothetical protein